MWIKLQKSFFCPQLIPIADSKGQFTHSTKLSKYEVSCDFKLEYLTRGSYRQFTRPCSNRGFTSNFLTFGTDNILGTT